MESTNLPERYLAERNQLLRWVSDQLESDPGVVAAWLFGSLGRGTADPLSDIDLWVVVKDAKIDRLISKPHAYASQVGQPILFVEAPQNAPIGGAYLMTGYDAPVAPHIVDWYWQPRSLAYIPNQVRLLFDREGLRRDDQTPRFQGGPAKKEIIERPIHFLSFFWMMLMITAKHVARAPQAESMALLPMLVDPLVQAQRFLGGQKLLLLQDLPDHPLPGEKIRLLYQLADRMRSLTESIAARGEAVPDLVIPGAYRYLELVKSMVLSG